MELRDSEVRNSKETTQRKVVYHIGSLLSEYYEYIDILDVIEDVS